MKLFEAIDKGYIYGSTCLHSGYVSRKVDVSQLEVKYSKKGYDDPKTKRPYVLLPNFNSTRYCIKQYLIPPEDADGWKQTRYLGSEETK
jgi:hypothetical protein